MAAAPSGGDDTAALQAKIDQANANYVSFLGLPCKVLLGSGTYSITGLTMRSGVVLEGVGVFATVVKVANGANADALKTASFDSLTLTGSGGGAGGWAVRNLAVDGNKANNSSGYGIRAFGYDFDISDVRIRNCAGDGLYTEYGVSQGGSTPDSSPEARIVNVKIHDNGGHGWHNRGPDDLQAANVLIYRNGSSSYGYWGESLTTGGTAIQGGSVGQALGAGSFTLTVATTLNFPSAGTLTVPSSAGGTATITYTGKTGTTFTGCTGGTAATTIAAGNAIPTGGYSSAGTQITNMHCWGGQGIAAVFDANTYVSNSEFEGAVTGMVLIRSNDVTIMGGAVFYLSTSSKTGYGVTIGDTANAVSGTRIITTVRNFTGADAAHAPINIVNSGGNNSLDCQVYYTSGTSLFTTTTSASDTLHIESAGQTQAANKANSTHQIKGTTLIDGHLLLGDTATHPTVAVGSAAGSGAPTPGNQTALTDGRGLITMGTGTSPTAGGQMTVTLNSSFSPNAVVVACAANAATGLLGVYATVTGANTFIVGFANAPAASQAVGTYVIGYIVIG